MGYLLCWESNDFGDEVTHFFEGQADPSCPAMANVDLRSITQPVGIMRIMATILTCMCFSLVAAVGHVLSPTSSYWAWCMFTWCFCFVFSFLILILEFTTVNTKLPFGWDDFTAAFAILASLMCLTTSIIYPTFFAKNGGPRQIGASVVSWVCFGVYVGEVVLTRLRPSGETIGFLSTLPGIMKMLETLLACLIFTSLEGAQFVSHEIKWCVSVYALCFIFNVVIILLTLGRLASSFPFPFDKLVIGYNILATVMYMTAMVMWPLYSFRLNICEPGCDRDKLIVVTFMTIINSIVYILDTANSIRLVFCGGNHWHGRSSQLRTKCVLSLDQCKQKWPGYCAGAIHYVNFETVLKEKLIVALLF